MQPVNRVPSAREAEDWVVWSGKCPMALAVTASWGLPMVRLAREWQVWKFLPATGHTSSLLGTGARGGWSNLALPGLWHVSTGQQDSVTQLPAKPPSEAGRAQTRRHCPVVWTSLAQGSSSIPCKDRSGEQGHAREQITGRDRAVPWDPDSGSAPLPGPEQGLEELRVSPRWNFWSVKALLFTSNYGRSVFVLTQ